MVSIKKLFPDSLKSLLLQAKAFFPLMGYTLYWFGRDLKYSNLNRCKESRLSGLMISSHVLEKGITMPNRRYGFGYDRVREVIRLTKNCIKEYGCDSIEVQSTLDDLFEYKKIHDDNSFELPDDINQNIDNLMTNRVSINKKISYSFTADDFFSNYSSFEEFAGSRHTCRHYSKEDVPLGLVKKCVEIAMTAPSACNRQSVRIKIIDSQENKDFVLGLQNGNRGFGEYANKIILITSDQRYWSEKTRTSAYLDGGIFVMNLLYAFHSEKIAACTLNAHLTPKQIKLIHYKLNVSKAEIPIVFIAIGYAPNEFLVARSQRVNVDDIYKIL